MATLESPTQDQVQYSNTNIVRDTEGKITVWVGNEKIIGLTSATLQPQPDGVGMWVFIVPGNRVRLCERVPAAPVYETKDNVIQFPNFRAALAHSEFEPPPLQSA